MLNIPNLIFINQTSSQSFKAKLNKTTQTLTRRSSCFYKRPTFRPIIADQNKRFTNSILNLARASRIFSLSITLVCVSHEFCLAISKLVYHRKFCAGDIDFDSCFVLNTLEVVQETCHASKLLNCTNSRGLPVKNRVQETCFCSIWCSNSLL